MTRHLYFGSVASSITAITNNPAELATSGGGGTTVTVALDAAGAYLDAQPSRTFGGQSITARYTLANGDLSFTGPGSVVLAATSSGKVQNVRYEQGNLSLNTSGAVAESLRVYLPGGLGYSSSESGVLLNGSIELTNYVLDSTLEIPDLNFTNGGQPIYLVHERLPHRIRVTSIYWSRSQGRFEARGVQSTKHVRGFEDTVLAQSIINKLVNPGDAVKMTNDGWLRAAYAATGSTVYIRTDASGKALIDINMSVGPGTETAHFPLGVAASFASGSFTLEGSRVQSGQLVAADATVISYARQQAAGSGACASPVAPGSITLPLVTGGLWKITADGGLDYEGAVTPSPVQWGPAGGGDFVHQLDAVASGRVLLAGHTLPAEAVGTGVTPVYRPAIMLLSGHGKPGTTSYVERPLTAGYDTGDADYPGLNLRAGSGVSTARSHLAGEKVGPYGLKPISKYYLRPAGVSGVHDAVTADVVPMPIFYGYNMNLDGLRLAYLDCDCVASATSGGINLPFPSQIQVPFRKLMLTSTGEFRGAELNAMPAQPLAYWGVTVSGETMEFRQKTTPGGCPVAGQAFLSLGVRAAMPSISAEPLYGLLGFTPTGRLVSAATSQGTGVDSRLALPGTITVAREGTAGYALTPVTKAILNDYDSRDAADPGVATTGFVSLAGTLDVPFFEDIKVHLHANPAATAGAQVYLMGGWTSDPADDGMGWTVNGRNYFNDPQFDAAQRGYPQGVTLAKYHENPDGEQYHPRARHNWQGVVDLRYPLAWSPARRTFQSAKSSENTFLILKTKHQLQELTTEGCSLTFGAEFSTPRINVNDLLAKTRLSNVLNTTINTQILTHGIDQLERLTSDQLEKLVDAPLDAAINTVANTIADNLRNFYETNSIKPHSFSGLDIHIVSGAGDAVLTDLVTALNNIAETSGQLGQEINGILDDGIAACDQGLALVGKVNGSRTKILAAVQSLRSVIPGTPALPSDMTSFFKDAEAALADAERAINAVRSKLVEIRNSAAVLGQIKTTLGHIAGSLSDAGLSQIVSKFLAEHDITGKYFDEFSPEQVRAKVRAILKQYIVGNEWMGQVKSVLRTAFRQVREELRSSLDLVMSEINRILNKAVSSAQEAVFSELEGAVDGATRDSVTKGVGNFVAAGKLDGYAQIDGDTIREIRMNASLKLSVADAFAVDGWFRLLNVSSDTPATSCRPPGVVATEVTVGAHGKAKFGDIDVDARMEGRFAFGQNWVLTGLDGSLDLESNMTVKEASFDKVSLAFAFGGGEGFVAGRVGVTVRFITGEGYMFFGTTRNPMVFSYMDPQSTALIKGEYMGELLEIGGQLFPDGPSRCMSKPLTGVYFGFSGAASLNKFFGIPDTCLLRIHGLVDNGTFCFLSQEGGRWVIRPGISYNVGIRGEVACVADVTGKVGAAVAARIPIDPSSPDAFVRSLMDAEARGVGSVYLSGKFGPCPLCITLEKTLRMFITLSKARGVEVEFDL